MASTKTYRKLGPVQSPVVSAAIDRRSNVNRASLAIRKALRNGSVLFIILIDLYFRVSSSVLDGLPLALLECVEIVLAPVLVLSCCHDLTVYLSVIFRQSKVKLTLSQCKKLGIACPASGYELIYSPEPFGEQVYVTATPHSHSSPFRQTFSSPSSAHSGSPCHVSPLTPHSSFTKAGVGHSPHTPSSLCGTKFVRKSPLSGEPIMDSRSLDRYLQQEEEKLAQLVSQDQFSSPQSLSSPNSSRVYGGQSPQSLSPRKYHIAPRISPSTPGGSPFCKSPENCGITRKDLDQWTERCRKWIAITILKPLANEIGAINASLSKKGKSEQIGMVSLDVLKRLSVQATPTLPMVIQYLEFAATKQEYLVERIKELATGTYLSGYCWDAGGSWKGKPWSIDLPSDSQIIIHLLSTYLDSHLPPDPWFPNGKTFSTQYFLKSVPPKNGSQQSICLVQTCSNPPVYKVLIKGKYINVAEGRNNLFHSICTFLHHVKTKEESMLGTINLETAGINILSIISTSKN